MLQQRKKDYLMRLHEEFMKSIHKLIDKRETLSEDEQQQILYNAFSFFTENFDVTEADAEETIIEKIPDVELLQQYARLLFINSQYNTNLSIGDLQKALQIIEYLQETDKTYSWEREVLREDILRTLEQGK